MAHDGLSPPEEMPEDAEIRYMWLRQAHRHAYVAKEELPKLESRMALIEAKVDGIQTALDNLKADVVPEVWETKTWRHRVEGGWKVGVPLLALGGSLIGAIIGAAVLRATGLK